jgi:DNA-binding CsgD family transcriptional regulator
MGTVEHLKTLCCLGLKPESAMVAVTPLLHEIIPHGWSRIVFLAPDASMGSAYAEHPAAVTFYCRRFRQFRDDPSSPRSLWESCFRAVGIGWLLHLQGRGWLESGWYQEIEAPLDSCWILDAMIGDGSRSIAAMNLTRPRGARPFTVDDVRRLDLLRPWLAHAFQRRLSVGVHDRDPAPIGITGPAMLAGELILNADRSLIHQTANLEFLLRMLAGVWEKDTRYVPERDSLPAPILKLLRRIVGAANGSLDEPPRMQVATAYGVLTLEAKWLVPGGAIPADVSKDPKKCLIAVTIELREHAIAHAARVLRESGATPAQIKVGVQLAFGKTEPAIANDLGIKLSSVKDLTEKIYQTLDVHNAAELGTKIWLGQRQVAPRNGLRRAG